MDEQRLTTQHIEYSRTIVPSSMRSVYWNYFGFPSDSENNILTKQKIVCTLCNMAIAYNKNTSNLRTHLVSRHPEILHALHHSVGVATGGLRKRKYTDHTEEYAADSSTHKQDDFQQMPELKTMKVVFREECKQMGNTVADSEDGTQLVLTPKASQSSELIAVCDEMDENDFVDNNDMSCVTNDTDTTAIEPSLPTSEMLDVAQPYSYIDMIPTVEQFKFVEQPNHTNRIDLQVEALVQDLLPISTLTGSGFRQLLLSECKDNCNSTDISARICSLYKSMRTKIDYHVQHQSQQAAFALALESYRNFENCESVCIYFNYFDLDQNKLINLLYTKVEKNGLQLSTCLQHLDLTNCVVIMVGNKDFLPTVAEFATVNSIPTFECLDAVLTRCLNQVFELSSITSLFDELNHLISQDQLLELPHVPNNCAWSKLNLLQFVVDHDVLKQDANEKHSTLQEIKQLVEYLNPLKVKKRLVSRELNDIILKTIADEPQPFCTLIRPLVLKLFEEHFMPFQVCTDHVKHAKEILETELTHSIIDNTYLHEATFFDARFHHDFTDSQFQSNRLQLQEAICRQHKQLIELNIVTTVKLENEATEECVNGGSGGNPSSGLKSFFTRVSNGFNGSSRQAGANKSIKRSAIDFEFSRYNCEPSADLEQCPIDWWQEHAQHYKQLHKIAARYLCAPCCVNRWFHHDAEEHLRWRCKRSMLRQARHIPHSQETKVDSVIAESSLWYLHCNKFFYEKMNADAS